MRLFLYKLFLNTISFPAIIYIFAGTYLPFYVHKQTTYEKTFLLVIRFI